MKKERYERTELEIILFQMQDVIMVSDYEQDETPLMPPGNNN